MKNDVLLRLVALITVGLLSVSVCVAQPAGPPQGPPAPAAPPAKPGPLDTQRTVPSKPVSPVAPSEAGEPQKDQPAALEGTATAGQAEFLELPIDADAGAETDNTVSIMLDDVEMLNVVRMFTRISGANIIATPSNLQGRVTVNLTDVEWKPALESILDMHNLSLMEKTPGSGVYAIVPKPEGAPEPMVVETIFLDYTTVQEVSSVIKAMLIEGSSVSEFASRNALVIKTTAANLSEIKLLIEVIDILGEQICIETKFMELSDEASKKLGIRWDSLDEFGVRLGAGPFSYGRSVNREKDRRTTVAQSDSRTDADNSWRNRGSVDNSSEYYDMDNDQIEKTTYAYLDLDNDGLFTSAGEVIAEVTPTRTVQDTDDSGRNITTDILRTDVTTYDMLDHFNRTIAEQQAAILDVDSFNIVLSALKKTDGVTVISNPKIIVANGATNAFFSVGEREPIIKTTIETATADSPERIIAELDTSINTEYIKEGYLETGIDLRVIPVVKTDDLIEAEITPSLRRMIGSKVVEDNSWPIISVKEIRTRFTLKSGQTVAIGGLTDTKDDKRVSKIPLLGDIPLLGKYLFSHTQEVKKQIETIIFVTLSLAQPHSLIEETGIPEQAELVHKKMIQGKRRREKFEGELQLIREAAEAESAKRAEKVKNRLLKRKK